MFLPWAFRRHLSNLGRRIQVTIDRLLQNRETLSLLRHSVLHSPLNNPLHTLQTTIRTPNHIRVDE